jgi:chromate transport protein ChrA
MNKNWLKWFLFNLKVGTLAFGGSGRILYYQETIVQKFKWITEEEMRELITLAQTLPGPNLVNVAHLVGMKALGFWGSVFGLLGLMCPGSFMVVMIYQYLPIENFYYRVIFQGFTLGSLMIFLLLVANYARGVVDLRPSNSRIVLDGNRVLKIILVLMVVAGVLLKASFTQVLFWGALSGFLIETWVPGKTQKSKGTTHVS